VGIADGDLVIMADVDEIPSAHQSIYYNPVMVSHPSCISSYGITHIHMNSMSTSIAGVQQSMYLTARSLSTNMDR
jgi:hypothetical protein